MTVQLYRIQSRAQSGLYWSNSLGWTTIEEADTFDDDDKETSALPIGGKWVLIDPNMIE